MSGSDNFYEKMSLCDNSKIKNHISENTFVICALRMKKSLFKYSNLTVSKISDQVSFGDSNCFSNVFRAKVKYRETYLFWTSLSLKATFSKFLFYGKM